MLSLPHYFTLIFQIKSVNALFKKEPPLDRALLNMTDILPDINMFTLDLECQEFSDTHSRRLRESCGIFAEFHPAVLNREECL